MTDNDSHSPSKCPYYEKSAGESDPADCTRNQSCETCSRYPEHRESRAPSPTGQRTAGRPPLSPRWLKDATGPESGASSGRRSMANPFAAGQSPSGAPREEQGSAVRPRLIPRWLKTSSGARPAAQAQSQDAAETGLAANQPEASSRPSGLQAAEPEARPGAETPPENPAQTGMSAAGETLLQPEPPFREPGPEAGLRQAEEKVSLSPEIPAHETEAAFLASEPAPKSSHPQAEAAEKSGSPEQGTADHEPNFKEESARAPLSSAFSAPPQAAASAEAFEPAAASSRPSAGRASSGFLMREKDRQLSRQCQNWAQTARNAEQWLRENSENVGGECDLLCKNMRSAARFFGRLATAASRKMCVGVFGPSQAGKSYLISALARDSKGELMADFAGKTKNFIKDINPEGGKESTGLVTRFTTTPPKGITPENPVRLRLFSEMDLVRIFANTYYADCDHKEAPSKDAILAKLREVEAKADKNPVNDLTRDDLEDLREYLQKHFASRPRVQMLQNTYWGMAGRLLPQLELVDRARLFGIIWNNTEEFDRYFLALARALHELGNPAEVNCPLEALLPREKGIIDVSLLSSQTPGATEQIRLESDEGRSAMLDRCLVTALTAELSIYMPEKPDEFFEYTDLLDFPGYRSRLKTNNLAEALKTPGQLENFFLRGKVAYLFERYCDEQELTSMLLCIGPSNQEVQDLPEAINNWICLTQGETPEARRGRDPMLYFILTKMDVEFERKQGVEDAGNRWNNRMESSLTRFFGAQYNWPSNWDGKPFRNMFLLRNPNYRSDALFTFDDQGNETGIRQDIKDFVGQVHQAFLSSEKVLRHFLNPEEAWNAAMKLNDGGIELLRRKLAPICDPDRKYNQTKSRAISEAKKLSERLQPYYTAGELQERILQKKALGVSLTRTLVSVASHQQFADFLSRFQVDDHELYEIALDCSQLPENGSVPSQTVVGTAGSEKDFLDELDLSGLLPDSPPPIDTAPAREDPARTAALEGTDQITVFCSQAVSHWSEVVRAQAEKAPLQKLYGVGAEFMNAFASELVLGARHVKLLEEMIASIRANSGFRNIPKEVAAWRMASEAAYRINSFVAWLGHDVRLGQGTEIIYNGTPVRLFAIPQLSFGPHGEPVVPEQQTQYDKPYYMDWFRAFVDCVISSVNETDDKFNPVQNELLGKILAALEAPGA